MARCETCGNDYDQSFEVVMKGVRHTYDSFECAIYALAPHCATCQVRIIGHGLQAGSALYCCAHCAGKAGAPQLQDRA